MAHEVRAIEVYVQSTLHQNGFFFRKAFDDSKGCINMAHEVRAIDVCV